MNNKRASEQAEGIIWSVNVAIKKIKKQEFYLSDDGKIVCFICYEKTSKIS